MESQNYKNCNEGDKMRVKLWRGAKSISTQQNLNLERKKKKRREVAAVVVAVVLDEEEEEEDEEGEKIGK